MRFQILLLEPGSPVDALEHRTLLIAPPVRAGVVGQLEVLDAARVGDVGSATEVDERAVGVGRDDLIRTEVVDALELERIVGKALLRLGAVDLRPDEGQLLGGDLSHLRFELLEIVRGEWLLHTEVVVEPVFDRRAEADLRVGPHAAHRGREHVRGAVAQHIERLCVLFGEHAEGTALPQRRHQVLRLAIQLDGDGRLQQSRSDPGDDVARESAFRHLSHRAVGKCQRERRVGRGSVDHDVLFRAGT